MAIAAMVCGIAGLVLFIVAVPSIVAVVLGFIAASKAKRSGETTGTGLGMARAGWILGIIGVGLFVLVVTLAATGVIDDEVSVSSLDPGDCVDLDPTEDEIDELPLVDCDEPHDGEVYFVDEVDIEGDDFPGVPALAAEIERQCTGSPFEEYVGTPYRSSEIGLFFLHPIEDGWERGDREFVCIAVEMDGSRLTESVEGSGR